MAKIITANCMTWEEMVKTGYHIECEYDCQVGDIIDECFVYCGRSPTDTSCKKGDVTYVIPLRSIGVAETYSDLSRYGFYKADKDNRWIRYK